MNPSRIFIERPVATSLLMVAIILVGVIAYKFLPLSALPQVDYPTIRVLTLYPGASPEVMTSSVTAPLERQFGQMPGLNQMTSTSSAGASSITLQFDLKLGLDVAEQQVQAAINAAGNLLPSDLPSPPVYAKVNPADAPVLTLAVTSKSEPLTKVHDMVDTRLAQKISQLPGVGLVSLEGGQKPGVRIRANPTALAAYGLNVDDLRTTISNANVNTPKGNFDGPARAYTINANDQVTDPATFRDIVVAYRNGAPVRVSDVATVEDRAARGLGILFDIALYGILGLVVIKQPIAFHHVQLLGERRAIHVDHGKRPDLDTHRINDQRVAFVMADRIPIPRWRHLRGMRLVHAHAADFIAMPVDHRDVIRPLEHLHQEIPKNVRHPAGPALVARGRIANARR